MYLFKCSCGCFFSMDQDTKRSPICPNCDNSAAVTRYTDIGHAKTLLHDAGMTMQVIPDNAKINISFDL